jgi:tetratricopeptide (TPR) repeat protein
VQTNRNLGLVLLLEKKYPEAEKALNQALRRVSRDLVVNRLLGRVYLGMEKRPEALRAYQAAEQVALRARGPVLAQIYAEMGPLYLDLGKPDQGVQVLDVAVREAGSSPVLKAAQRNLAVAYYRRGLERLKDAKQSDGALEDFQRAAALPRSALQAKEPTAIDCALAIAALKAGKVVTSQEAFTRAGKEGGCQFAPPYDKVGVEFFAAYAQYRESQAANPLRRDSTIKQLGKLLPRATGALTDLIKNVMRASYELQGYEWYVRNDLKRAGVALRNAQKLPAKGEQRTLDHNLAVIDLAQGRTVGAEKIFEQLAQRPPEALLNLGIVRDRQGDSRKALELYRKASERGVRAPKLKEWIDVKERILNSGGSQAGRSLEPGFGPLAASGSRVGAP